MVTRVGSAEMYFRNKVAFSEYTLYLASGSEPWNPHSFNPIDELSLLSIPLRYTKLPHSNALERIVHRIIN